jgi:hypothetical protein
MATWKKLILSGSNISQLNNDSGYLISNSTGVNLGGAFSGSFQGNGSELTNIAASSLTNALEDGNGIANFSYNGSTSGVEVAVEADGSTLTVGSGGVKVSDAGITPTQIATSVAGNGLAGGAGTALSVNVDDSTIEIDTDTLKVKTGGIGTTQIATSLGTIGTNQFTGSFSGSFSGDVDINLADLTAGNGLSGTAYDGNAARTFSVQADSTTGGSVKRVTVGSNGVGFDIRLVTGSGIGITSDKLVAAVDGTTVDVTSDTISVLKVPNALTVDDSTIQLNSGTTYDGSGAKTISVKDGGITNTKLDNSSLTIGSTSISLGGTATTVAGLTLTGAVGSGSFSGSFEGDGSGLTGLGGDLTVDGDSGTQTVNLLTDDLQIITDNANEIVTAVTKVGTDVKVKIGLPDDVVIGNDLTVTRDLIVNRDLTVAGTASFQHTENLEVADRFIRLASGSNAAGDGGFVVQQASNGTGDAFGFDGNATSRWGIAQNVDGADSTFTPAAFMASIVVGTGTDPDATATRYDQKGNIFVGTDANIWIYS